MDPTVEMLSTRNRSQGPPWHGRNLQPSSPQRLVSAGPSAESQPAVRTAGHGNQWNDVHSRGSWAIRGHTMLCQHPHPLKWLNHVVSARSFCILPSWFTQRLHSYSGNQYEMKHLILSYIFLTFYTSEFLPGCAFHLSILSEVPLLNFLRSYLPH